MSEVGRVTLIDRDVYERANLSSQAISAGNLGEGKARVQARNLRRINSRLRVTALHAAVESVPLGRLRADVILACLDSRRARQYVNQAAWRLGVPWVDAGVEGAGLLARVNVYTPGADSPCLECAWDERDYNALEQTYPCSGSVLESFKTDAPSSLGALAASLQAIECRKLLRGEETAAIGKQVLIDAAHHRHYVTSFKRNAACRLSDHAGWAIERLSLGPEALTVAEALELRAATSSQARASLRVEGSTFVRRLTCARCGHTKRLLRLRSSLRASEARCVRCAQQMLAAGIDVVERLSGSVLSPRQLSLSLGALGFRRNEVFSVGDHAAEAHYEIGSSTPDG
jgi:adenylyltransferase/sulfurtransferase